MTECPACGWSPVGATGSARRALCREPAICVWCGTELADRSTAPGAPDVPVEVGESPADAFERELREVGRPL